MLLKFRKIVGIACLLGYAHALQDENLVKRMQPDAIKDHSLTTHHPLVWGDVNFIHTTDLHGMLLKIKTWHLSTNILF
jgi:hypothetical protein